MAPLRLLLIVTSLLHLLLSGVVVAAAAAGLGPDSNDEPSGAEQQQQQQRPNPSSVSSSSWLSWEQEPADVIAVRGQSARLDCLIADGNSSSSDFTVHWFQDGLPVVLQPDQRRQILANGSLYFDKVVVQRRGTSRPPSTSQPPTMTSGSSGSDEGSYHCLLTLSNGGGALVSRSAQLRLAGLGREFDSWPHNITAQVGDSVRLECHIDSVPQAIVAWEKDGLLLSQTVSYHQFTPQQEGEPSRFVTLKSGVLHIYNAQPQDAGNYRCLARNEMTGKDRRSPIGVLSIIASSSLPPPSSETKREPQIVWPPPDSIPPSSPLWITEGDNATLECLASARPAPVIQWTVNGSILSLPDDETRFSSIVVGPSFITLIATDMSLSGDYGCLVIGGSGRVTPVASLRVSTRPEIVRSPKSQVFPAAKTVRFECEVSGSPTPEIRWLKDGRVLSISGRIKNRLRSAGLVSELVLSNTVTTDSGIYQCWAQNRAGQASAPARLIVNVSDGIRPDPPSNLRAQPISSTEVLLAWDPPTNVPIDDVKAYTIHYMPLLPNGSSGGEELQDVSTNYSFRIGNLKRLSNYTFYVRAYVLKAASDPSEKFNFSLSLPPVTPSIPTRPPPRTLFPETSNLTPDLTLQPISPTALKVTWRKFTAPGTTTAVPLYKIQYRRHRAKDFDIEVVRGDVYEYIITGLHPGRKYDVSVVPGITNVVAPWFTQEMPRVMNPDTEIPSPTLAAPVVELLANNATSIVVSWEDLGGGRKRAEQVRLTYRKQGSRESSPVLLLSSSGSQLVGQLESGTVYDFQVTAIAAGGLEGPVTSLSIRTLWEAPSAAERESEEVDDFDQGPISLDSNVLSSSAIKLSWQQSPSVVNTESGHIMYYTVRYISIPEETLPILPGSGNSAPRASRYGYIRTTTNEVLLTNLTAYTLYRIAVRAHDHQGRSSTYSSPQLDVRTLADLPSPPLNLSWLVLADGAVQVSWKPPLHPNGIIQSYAILVSNELEAADDDWSKLEEGGSRLRSQLRGLQFGSLYFIRVKARTQAGWGEATAAIAALLQVPLTLTPSPQAEVTPGGVGDKQDGLESNNEQYLGVIIGLVIGLSFAVVCAVVMIWRSRFCKGLSQPDNSSMRIGAVADASAETAHRSSALNGSAMCNGNGFHHHGKVGGAGVCRSGPFGSRPNSTAGGCTGLERLSQQQQHHQSLVEMEDFVPMLQSIPVNVAPTHLDTKGGYPLGTGTHCVRRDESLSNGSVSIGLLASKSTIPADEEEDDEEEEEGTADRSQVPLLSIQGDADVTLLSQATEMTCLSSMDYSVQNPRQHQRRPHRRRSLHSHDSSLHSSLSSSSGGGSSQSLRGHEDNDNNTGISRNVDHQMNDSGLVVTTAGSADGAPSGSSELHT